MSGYPYTWYNIPFILYGTRYDEQNEQQYFTDTLQKSPLFDELERRGYAMAIYDEDVTRWMGYDETSALRFEDVGRRPKTVSSYSAFVRWQILMVGMKYAPFDFKRFCFVNPAAFGRLKNTEKGKTAFDQANMDFYQLITERDLAYRKDKSFKFIHLYGAHPPYEYDGEMQYLPDGGTYAQSCEMCIYMSDLYLQKLKESGVYDDSVIVIISDHGNTEDNWNQHPVLLIKGINERHELKVDDRPLSFENLQAAYLNLLNDSDGQRAFEGVSGSKSRKFLFYEPFRSSTEFIEYEQTGKAGDMRTMNPTGMVFEGTFDDQ